MKAKDILINKLNDFQNKIDILIKIRDKLTYKIDSINEEISSLQSTIIDFKNDKNKL